MEIRLKNLVKTYEGGAHGSEINAVRGISLSIPSNTIFGIIGKSGAGKSTLVRLISLLEKPDSGEVFYDGNRVDDLSPSDLIARRRRIGMIFQNFNLFSSRTAGQNVAYPLEICGTPKAEIASRVTEMLSIVDLADRRNAPISTLSGGQKQRIAIARALAAKPDILFCDEATSALDPQTTESILNLIRKIQNQMNLTVVMITHQMEVVRDACSYVAVIDKGSVVEEGTVNDIFLHPKSNVTKDFLLNLTPTKEAGADGGIVRWSESGGKYVLRFTDTLTDEPVLSRMAQKFNVEFNIRAGGIQKLSESRVGTLITDIAGDADEVAKAIAYLKSEGVSVEGE